MTRVLAKHLPYDDGHLGKVLDEMALCGAPTIRTVRYRGQLVALEGSHRIAAAWATGITPKLVILAADPASCGECDPFFDRAIAALPAYDFGHVLMLELST